jgi:hypothetical protein
MRSLIQDICNYLPCHRGCPGLCRTLRDELTQIVPFEMVDQALAATGTAQARLRVLPSRVVVYLLLAGCLFAEVVYRQVWDKLTAGLGKLPVAHPSDNAL